MVVGATQVVAGATLVATQAATLAIQPTGGQATCVVCVCIMRPMAAWDNK